MIHQPGKVILEARFAGVDPVARGLSDAPSILIDDRGAARPEYAGLGSEMGTAA